MAELKHMVFDLLRYSRTEAVAESVQTITGLWRNLAIFYFSLSAESAATRKAAVATRAGLRTGGCFAIGGDLQSLC